MTLADDLRAARALIDTPEKWGKPRNAFFGRRKHHRSSLQMSAMGAIYDISTYNDSVGYEALYEALSASVPASFRLRGAVGAIAQYNDHPATTHADMMALFDRAIAAAESAP